MSQLTPPNSRVGFHHPDVGERKRWRPPRTLADAAWIFFAVLWVVTITVMVMSPTTIEEVWAWIGDQNAVIEVAIWVLALPAMVALAAWQTSWALWIRILILIACVLWTTVGLYPDRVAPEMSEKGSLK